VRLHAQHLDEDVCVANECLGQLETAQIETNTKLVSVEITLGAVNTSLVGIFVTPPNTINKFGGVTTLQDNNKTKAIEI
jgi:hypothetical protein